MTHMTTEQIREHEQEMAVQRERFRRFWEQIITQFLWNWDERSKLELMQRAWNLWREQG